MVKGRGKGKKQYSAAAREDGGDEKMPVVRRRGRPLKLLKEDDEMYAYAEEEVSGKIKNEDGVEERISTKNSVSRTDLKNRAVVAAAKKKRKKKKRAVNVGKKNVDLVVKEEDEEDIVEEEDKVDVMKTVGLKQIGSSRRKSKPHRAAEVGVECL